MVNSKLLFTISFFLLFVGCTFQRNNFTDDPLNTVIPTYSIGVDVLDTKDGCVLNNVYPDSPASKSGMKPGDVVLTINNVNCSDKELTKMMYWNSGEKVNFKIDRNGQATFTDVLPQRVYTTTPTTHKLTELLYVLDRKVTLAVIVADVKNNVNDPNRESWESATRQQLQSMIEAGMIKRYGQYDKFMLVDRSRLDTILREYNISLTGLVSDEARIQIGKMTSATHLLITSSARFPNGQGSEDLITSRLIEVETGRVLATDVMHAINR